MDQRCRAPLLHWSTGDPRQHVSSHYERPRMTNPLRAFGVAETTASSEDTSCVSGPGIAHWQQRHTASRGHVASRTPTARWRAGARRRHRAADDQAVHVRQRGYRHRRVGKVTLTCWSRWRHTAPARTRHGRHFVHIGLSRSRRVPVCASATRPVQLRISRATRATGRIPCAARNSSSASVASRSRGTDACTAYGAQNPARAQTRRPGCGVHAGRPEHLPVTSQPHQGQPFSDSVAATVDHQSRCTCSRSVTLLRS